MHDNVSVIVTLQNFANHPANNRTEGLFYGKGGKWSFLLPHLSRWQYQLITIQIEVGLIDLMRYE